MSFYLRVQNRLLQVFNPDQLVDILSKVLANLIITIIILLIFYILWKLLDLILTPLLKQTPLDDTTLAFLELSSQFVVYAIGIMVALSAVGIRYTSLFASVGIIGLTLGFAARDTLSNIISGLLIYWDRPFVINDLIEAQGYYGQVEKITLRSTRVVTPDGRMVAIPNAVIANGSVASFTNFPHLRLEVEVTVGVEEDLDRVRDLLLALVEEKSRYLQSPDPYVGVKNLGDYNVTMVLYVWLKHERQHLQQQAQLRKEVFEALREAGVDMPFETIQLEPVRVIRQDRPGHAMD